LPTLFPFRVLYHVVCWRRHWWSIIIERELHHLPQEQSLMGWSVEYKPPPFRQFSIIIIIHDSFPCEAYVMFCWIAFGWFFFFFFLVMVALLLSNSGYERPPLVPYLCPKIWKGLPFTNCSLPRFILSPENPQNHADNLNGQTFVIG
jgi:hypothetical protein